MPTSSNKSHYKRIRCRYFDEEDGTPIYPGCSQGSNCRFIHPTDRNWLQKTATVHSQGMREKEGSAGDRQEFRDRHVQDKTENTPKRRNSPLPPQADLFISRCSQLDDRDDSDLEEADSRRNGVETHENVGSIKREIKDLDADQQWLNLRQDVVAKGFGDEGSQFEPARARAREDAGASDEERKGVPLTQGLSEVFTNYCNVSNQVLQDIALTDREHSTLRTYSEILFKLSSISPSATSAVASTLSQVLQKHLQSQERVVEGNQLLCALWEGVCRLFTREIAASFEIHHQKLANDFKRAQEHALTDLYAQIKSIKAPTLHVEERRSRSALTTADHKRKESTHRNHSADRKRRKLSVDTMEGSRDDRRKRASTASVEEVAEMLDMRTKLEDLAKENKELRACLRKREGRTPERR